MSRSRMLIEVGIGIALAAGLVVFALRHIQSGALAEMAATHADSTIAPRD
jgi:uncharacterized membrane protein YccC